MKTAADALISAAERVWRAFLEYGPVDDGRPEGDEFSDALDGLMEATAKAAADRSKRRKSGAKKGRRP